MIKEYRESTDALRTMANRLSEIDRLPSLPKSRAKVVLLPHQDLSLLDFASSLRMMDMPMGIKLKALTNSFFPIIDSVD